MTSAVAGFSFCKYLSATEVLDYVGRIHIIIFREYLLEICVSFTSNCHSLMNFFTVFALKAERDKRANLPLWDPNVGSSGDAVSHTPSLNLQMSPRRRTQSIHLRTWLPLGET